MEVLLDYLFEEDNTEEIQCQKQIRKTVLEPLTTIDDIEFSREEIKHAIESFNDKNTPGIDGITAGIYLRIFKMFPNLLTTIYNQ